MNSHGRLFQVSIGMVELKDVHNPNINVYWGPVNYTSRELILHQETSEGKQMFLS